MTKLSFKEKLLLSLYNGTPKGALTYRPLTYLYKLFPKANPGTIRVLVSGLKEESLIEKVERNKKVFLTLTSQGLSSILGVYLTQKPMQPEAGKKEEWDGFFSLAIMNIPESRKNLRGQMRQILFEANFRHLQSGIWISPHKQGINSAILDKTLGSEKIASFLTLVMAKKIFGVKSTLPQIYSLWNLAEIKKNYEILIWENVSLAKMKHFDALGYINLLNWEERLLLNIRADPLFPHNFYPLAILRKRVVKVFLTLSQIPIL